MLNANACSRLLPLHGWCRGGSGEAMATKKSNQFRHRLRLRITGDDGDIYAIRLCVRFRSVGFFSLFFLLCRKWYTHTQTVHYREVPQHVECWNGVSKHNLQVRITNQPHQATAGQRAASVE